jgi:hypothetical protein
MEKDLWEVRGIAGKVTEDAKERGTQVSPDLHDSCNLKCGCITHFFYSFGFITFNVQWKMHNSINFSTICFSCLQILILCTRYVM